MKRGCQLLCFLIAGVSSALATSRPAPACVGCHEQAKSQPDTSMAHALETAEECRILSSHPLLTFKDGKYSYRIERHGDQSLYSVSDGAQTLTLPIRWTMGASSAIGQTYILESKGDLYESRVSYFSELKGLDLTMGAQGFAPTNILDAVGRQLGRDEVLKCFGCHATNAVQGRELTTDTMTPGVQCERCHGPAEEHLAAVARGDAKPSGMKDLSKLSTDQISNFCGQCHRTWEEIAFGGKLDVTDIRFQPYRLAGSKCYDLDDLRISCLACHDPHREVDSNSADYDSKCEACHSRSASGQPGAKACKVATNRCASCHMPKIELPGAHHKFTDHRIRIVKANERFPG